MTFDVSNFDNDAYVAVPRSRDNWHCLTFFHIFISRSAAQVKSVGCLLHRETVMYPRL